MLFNDSCVLNSDSSMFECVGHVVYVKLCIVISCLDNVLRACEQWIACIVFICLL